MLLLGETQSVARYFLEIAFRGTHYHGWQVQPGAATVQAAVEKALSALLRHETRVVGCGRTDAGVHASQFFLHFDTATEPNADELVYRLNGILDPDIAAQQLLAVDDEAHARFGASERTYRYFIHRHKDPFLNDRSTFVHGAIDVSAMNEAAQILRETEDFKAFSKVNPDLNHHRCDVRHAAWIADGDRLVFEISADRFLRNMVRAVVGTLLEVGRGKMDRAQFDDVIASRERGNAGTSVDAKGLFLHRVKYPFINE